MRTGQHISNTHSRAWLPWPLLLRCGRCTACAAGLLAGALSGCAWKILPPVDVREPTEVYLSEYGRHTRLALPSPDGKFVEFGFGEWNYYGLERHGVFSALRAIAGLGSGAFSRRSLPPAQDGRPDMRLAAGSRAVPIRVERRSSDRLLAELEARWRSNRNAVAVRRWDGVPVSRDASRYHLFRNSNHATAAWLKELGCTVRGVPLTSSFQVQPDRDNPPSDSP